MECHCPLDDNQKLIDTAVQNSNWSMVAFLLEKGLTPEENIADIILCTQHTYSHPWIGSASLVSAVRTIEKYVDLDWTQCKNGKIPYKMAIAGKNLDFLDLLREKGIKPDIVA